MIQVLLRNLRDRFANLVPTLHTKALHAGILTGRRVAVYHFLDPVRLGSIYINVTVKRAFGADEYTVVFCFTVVGILDRFLNTGFLSDAGGQERENENCEEKRSHVMKHSKLFLTGTVFAALGARSHSACGTTATAGVFADGRIGFAGVFEHWRLVADQRDNFDAASFFCVIAVAVPAARERLFIASPFLTAKLAAHAGGLHPRCIAAEFGEGEVAVTCIDDRRFLTDDARHLRRAPAKRIRFVAVLAAKLRLLPTGTAPAAKSTGNFSRRVVTTCIAEGFFQDHNGRAFVAVFLIWRRITLHFRRSSFVDVIFVTIKTDCCGLRKQWRQGKCQCTYCGDCRKIRSERL